MYPVIAGMHIDLASCKLSISNCNCI